MNICLQQKCIVHVSVAHPHPVVYATDRSKAVALVLFLFVVFTSRNFMFNLAFLLVQMIFSPI